MFKCFLFFEEKIERKFLRAADNKAGFDLSTKNMNRINNISIILLVVFLMVIVLFKPSSKYTFFKVAIP